MINYLMQGFLIVFSNPINILVIILGVGAGIIIGAMPGLTATMGIAIALPLTFGMPPEVGLTLLISIFIGGIHGGGIPAILIKTPGTPASAATISDGFALTQKGEASIALGVHVFSSSTGSFLSAIILIFASALIAEFALKFGAAEYFLLAILGLTIISVISVESTIKGLIAGVLGLLLSTCGLDPMVGYPRFTFNNYNLMEGFSLVPALIGLFAISQMFFEIEIIDIPIVKVEKVNTKLPNFSQIKKIFPTIIRASIIGNIIGAIPGPGAVLGSFVPYQNEKRLSKHPEKFGHGAIEGIAAAEAGNNAAAIGALIPTLTLGIPGEAATAVLLGGLMILGLRPGPLLFKNNPEIVYAVFASIIIACFVLLIEGLILAQYMGKLITIPKKILLPIIFLLCLVGAFAIRRSVFDISIALIFGILGYFLQKLKFGVVPVLLGLILGPIAEANLRRALIISRGNLTIFFNNWLDISLILLGILSLIFGIKLSKSLKKISKESSVQTD